ncbi:hypothetical protein [Streptosporangium saharense]|uniref:hypothetical protein n=1 Tax=Streptosporangium saharense TaxID=1706840 RepID=UPI00332D21A0
MPSSYLSWAAAVELFERRGLPRETYRDLYEEEYILCPGNVPVAGELSLDDHDASPWCADTPDQATGYVIDGDLTVEGNVVNVDDGSSALVVLGSLRAANLLLEGDVKLVVLGDVEVETLVGNWTDKLVTIHGDLRTTVTILWNGFHPDRVGGTLRGRTLAPGYLDLTDLELGGVEDPGPGAPLSALLVSEVLVDGEPGPDDFAEIGVRAEALRERLYAGLPLVRRAAGPR